MLMLNVGHPWTYNIMGISNSKTATLIINVDQIKCFVTLFILSKVSNSYFLNEEKIIEIVLCLVGKWFEFIYVESHVKY